MHLLLLIFHSFLFSLFIPLNTIWHSLPASRRSITCRLSAFSSATRSDVSLKQQKGRKGKKGGEAGEEDREDGRLVCGTVSQTVQHFLCYLLSMWEKSIPPSLLSSRNDKDGHDYSSLHKGKLIPQGLVCVCACLRPCLQAQNHQGISFPFMLLRDNSVGAILRYRQKLNSIQWSTRMVAFKPPRNDWITKSRAKITAFFFFFFFQINTYKERQSVGVLLKKVDHI